MSLNTLSNDTYRTLCRTCAVISCVGMAAISVYHIITFQKYSSFKKRCILPVYLSMLFLFFGMYTAFNVTIEIFDDFHTPAFCGYSKWVAIPSYIAYKCLLYLILVHRIYDAYRESHYQVFTDRQLKIWAAVVITWSFANVVLIWLTATVKFKPDLVPKCHTHVFPPGLMAMALLDLVACGVNLYLFVKPVNTELTHMAEIIDELAKGHPNVTRQDIISAATLKHVALKQRVLSITAVSTTVIGMIFIAMFSMEQLFIGLDINLSTLSVILMYKWNDTLATKLCCCIKPYDDPLPRALERQPSQSSIAKRVQATSSKHAQSEIVLETAVSDAKADD